MTKRQLTHLFLTAFAAATLLAATQIGHPSGWPLAGIYAYWLVRILLESGLFLAFAQLIGLASHLRPHPAWIYLLAAVASLVPFVLSVTALDIVLGLPELDASILTGPAPSTASDAFAGGRSHLRAFLLELGYLADNHFALCLMLSLALHFSAELPAAFRAGSTTQAAVRSSSGEAPTKDAPSSEYSAESRILRDLCPPLAGQLLRAEAQEHYVRLITHAENRMVLYRFNDIVAELPDGLGMRVHRSHWVAYPAVLRLIRDSGRPWLALSDGSRIPVSRRYAADVQHRFGKLS